MFTHSKESTDSQAAAADDGCVLSTVTQRKCWTDDKTGEMRCRAVKKVTRKCPGKPKEELERRVEETVGERPADFFSRFDEDRFLEDEEGRGRRPGLFGFFEDLLEEGERYGDRILRALPKRLFDDDDGHRDEDDDRHSGHSGRGRDAEGRFGRFSRGGGRDEGLTRVDLKRFGPTRDA